MDARALVALVLLTGTAWAQDGDADVDVDVDTSLHAAVAPNGDEVRLTTTIGGKAAGAVLQVGKRRRPSSRRATLSARWRPRTASW